MAGCESGVLGRLVVGHWPPMDLAPTALGTVPRACHETRGQLTPRQHGQCLSNAHARKPHLHRPWWLPPPCPCSTIETYHGSLCRAPNPRRFHIIKHPEVQRASTSRLTQRQKESAGSLVARSARGGGGFLQGLRTTRAGGIAADEPPPIAVQVAVTSAVTVLRMTEAEVAPSTARLDGVGA